MTVAGPLASPQARQALCWAFPYDEVIEGVYEGYAKRAVGPVAELCHGFDPDTFVYETDLERARALLQEAEVAPGTTLSMPLPPGNPEGPSIAELFRTNLETVGLRLEAVPVDFATYVGMLYGDLPAEERPNLPHGVLVARLQRRLEPTLAPSLVSGLASGQRRPLLQRAGRGIAGADADRW